MRRSIDAHGNQKTAILLVIAVLFLVLLAPGWVLSRQAKEKPMNTPVSYRTVQVDDLSIFYREAGPKDAPALLLLHGLPSSSRMYEPLAAPVRPLSLDRSGLSGFRP